MLGLKWMDADLDAGTLTVRRSLDVDGTFKAPKNRAVKRSLKLTPRALDALKAHKASQNADAYRLGRAGRVMASCSPTPCVNR